MPTQSVLSVNLSLPLWSRCGPARSNNGDENVATIERIRDVLAEIESQGNWVHVHEDIVFAEMTLQPVMDVPGDPRGIHPLGR